MRERLFRQEAINQQHDRLHGEVLVYPSISHCVIGGFIALCVVATGLWLVNSQFARKETVTGWLEPPEGVVKVYTQNNSGKVKTVLVRDGQYVERGQALLIINGDQFLADGRSLEQVQLEELTSQHEILTEELQRRRQITQRRTHDLNSQIAATRQDIVSVELQLETLRQRQSIIDKRQTDFTRMSADGHISRREQDDVRQQALALQSDYQGLKRDKISQQNRLAQLVTQRDLLPSEHQSEQAALQRQISEVALRIQQLHGQRAQTIRATKAGYITNLQVSAGQYSDPRRPLMTIVPNTEEIVAKLLVPVRAVGFVANGQKIDIRYDAFPYQKFGLYQGEITGVSEVISLPDELKDAPALTNQPVYLVHARLHMQHVVAYGQHIPLKAGMTMSADITLGSRSMLEWVLEPVLSLRGRL